MIKQYEKIETVFERDPNTKLLNEDNYRNPVVEYLKDNQWEFTEKIDGTNIRVYWDGHKVSFFGRTDNSQIPASLYNKLQELFLGNENEEMFEQKFGETPVILFGEGYGSKIQNGGDYRSDVSFILFDVFIYDVYLSRENVKNVADYFNIDAVPVIMTGTLKEGIDWVKSCPNSTIGTAKAEGLVARPMFELKDKNNNRIIVKIKVRDFVNSKDKK